MPAPEPADRLEAVRRHLSAASVALVLAGLCSIVVNGEMGRASFAMTATSFVTTGVAMMVGARRDAITGAIQRNGSQHAGLTTMGGVCALLGYALLS